MEHGETIATSGTSESAEANLSNPSEKLPERESKELIIGFSGPVGCGVDIVREMTQDVLESLSYKIVDIKISEYIKMSAKSGLIDDYSADLSSLSSQEKYPQLQEAGNRLRAEYGADILAELAITRIATHRTSLVPNGMELMEYVPEKTAYLVDQLKHPEEVNLLRKVYGNLFFLVGVFASSKQRRENLVSKQNIEETKADEIMETDRKENDYHGQQLDKTLQLADIFVRNNNPQEGGTCEQKDRIKSHLKRFLNLLHHQIGITPTQHETAMHAAYIAGLSSACLSRQVGAAITDPKGNILSTGCNDVPKAGGGLYDADSKNDKRCYKVEGKKCFNDDKKRGIRDKIERILCKQGQLNGQKASELADAIHNETELKNLLEFSRSVHAEMDAITSAARVGTISIGGGYMYTTTFPCHNCARHIVAAGITRIYYIEPYDKSFAQELHKDAFDQDPKDESSELVQLVHFEGIAPRIYREFFMYRQERKDDGILKQPPASTSQKILAEHLDNYRQIESKVSDFITEEKNFPYTMFTDTAA